MTIRWCSLSIYWLVCLLVVHGRPPHHEPTLHKACTGPGNAYDLSVVTHWDDSGRRKASIIITYPDRLRRSRDRFEAALEPTAEPGHFNLVWSPRELRRARLTLSATGFYVGNPATISLNQLVFEGATHQPVVLTISRTTAVTAYGRNDPNDLPPYTCPLRLPSSH